MTVKPVAGIYKGTYRQLFTVSRKPKNINLPGGQVHAYTVLPEISGQRGIGIQLKAGAVLHEVDDPAGFQASLGVSAAGAQPVFLFIHSLDPSIRFAGNNCRQAAPVFAAYCKLQ